MTEISEMILKHGYLPESIPASMDLFEEIEKLKKEKMPSYWRITTRSPTFRMWPILLVIA